MNYRHIYHAGNFADVLKHAVLARLVTYMKAKDKAFRVIDTHAGIGLYDLGSNEAQRRAIRVRRSSCATFCAARTGFRQSSSTRRMAADCRRFSKETTRPA